MLKNTLQRHNCRLVQSGVFRKNIAEITGRKSIIDLNYMGAAEFEWGALPESTQRMLTNIDFYDVFTFPQYVNTEGEPLMVYAPRMFIDHITKIVEELAKGENYYLKERCTLPEYLNGEITYNYTDFWWDIQNDFYIFFGEEKRDLVLAAQTAMRERSIGEVEVGDWDELSEYYSLANLDLDESAQEFLKPKKSRSIKRLVRILNNKINQESDFKEN